MLQSDGTFMGWAGGGGSNVKPLNWMVAPTVIEEQTGADGRLERLLVRKRGQDELLEVSVAEVLSDVEHELDTLASLEKGGIERELEELLADTPQWCGEGLRLLLRGQAPARGPW